VPVDEISVFVVVFDIVGGGWQDDDFAVALPDELYCALAIRKRIYADKLSVRLQDGKV
jgi:hypothetical protein